MDTSVNYRREYDRMKVKLAEACAHESTLHAKLKMAEDAQERERKAKEHLSEQMRGLKERAEQLASDLVAERVAGDAARKALERAHGEARVARNSAEELNASRESLSKRVSEAEREGRGASRCSFKAAPRG